jgi:hypothetical protein
MARQREEANLRLQYFLTMLDTSRLSSEGAEEKFKTYLDNLDEFLLLSGISDSILKTGYRPKLSNERQQVEESIRETIKFQKKDQTNPHTQIKTPKYIRGNINVFLTKKAVQERTRAIQDEISKVPGVVGVWYTDMTNALLVDVVVSSYEEADKIESKIRGTEGVSLTRSTFSKPSKNNGR